MAKFQQPDPKIELRYIIHSGKNLGQAYTIEEIIKYFDNSKEGNLLKESFPKDKDKILVAELLSFQAKINEKELAKQDEKMRIREGYGF